MTSAVVTLARTEFSRIGEPDRHEIAERIRARLADTVEAVLDVGAMLVAAKHDLAHGSFEAMIRDDLGWTPQTARKFTAIARHPVLADRAHVRDLPASWGTLAELAKLPPLEVEAAIEGGTVTPSMSRAAAASLVTKRPRKPSKRPPELRAPVSRDATALLENLGSFGDFCGRVDPKRVMEAMTSAQSERALRDLMPVISWIETFAKLNAEAKRGEPGAV